MDVCFVRIPKRESEALVYLDSRVFCVPSPGNLREIPPHDLGQFIVEHELRWQTGFWGYVARGVVFPSMYQKAGTRPPHGEERAKRAIRGAKDHLAEVESIAGAVAAIARGNLDGDADRVRHVFNQAWWSPHAAAPALPVNDIQRACRAFRDVETKWRALSFGDSLRFHWSFQAHALAPENPLDNQTSSGRRSGRG